MSLTLAGGCPKASLVWWWRWSSSTSSLQIGRSDLRWPLCKGPRSNVIERRVRYCQTDLGWFGDPLFLNKQPLRLGTGGDWGFRGGDRGLGTYTPFGGRKWPGDLILDDTHLRLNQTSSVAWLLPTYQASSQEEVQVRKVADSLWIFRRFSCSVNSIGDGSFGSWIGYPGRWGDYGRWVKHGLAARKTM